MPVKGITDTQGAFPQIGRIFKGAPKTPNMAGKDLTYFRFASDNEAIVRDFYAAYGPEPRAINFFLAGWSVWYEQYAADKLKWRADGYEDGAILVLHRLPDGTMSEEPIVYNQEIHGTGKIYTRIDMVIPELMRIATVNFTSTSFYDAMQLSANLNQVQTLAQLNGVSVERIPLTLYRQEVARNVRIQGRPARKTMWLCFIRIHDGYAKLQLTHQMTLTDASIGADAREAPVYLLEPEDVSEEGDEVVVDSGAVSVSAREPAPEGDPTKLPWPEGKRFVIPTTVTKDWLASLEPGYRITMRDAMRIGAELFPERFNVGLHAYNAFVAYVLVDDPEDEEAKQTARKEWPMDRVISLNTLRRAVAGLEKVMDTIPEKPPTDPDDDANWEDVNDLFPL